MNFKKRITELESRTGKLNHEKVVPVSTRTEPEFERKKVEYMEAHPEPELFIWLVQFS